MRKLKVKTYFSKDQENDKKYDKILRYIFNMLYRSIMPLMIFYTIVAWNNKPPLLTAFLFVILGFLVIYQFSWEIE